jgi:hypothetical protein
MVTGTRERKNVEGVEIMNVNCEQCNATFECGAHTGHCWCFGVEHITPDNRGTNCLCQSCLQQLVDKKNERTLDRKVSPQPIG